MEIGSEPERNLRVGAGERRSVLVMVLVGTGRILALARILNLVGLSKYTVFFLFNTIIQ